MADQPEQSDPEWFRPPTRREHLIGVALFGGFAAFFIGFSVVLTGTWSRWLFLVLGVLSVIRAARHALAARRAGGSS